MFAKPKIGSPEVSTLSVDAVVGDGGETERLARRRLHAGQRFAGRQGFGTTWGSMRAGGRHHQTLQEIQIVTRIEPLIDW